MKYKLMDYDSQQYGRQIAKTSFEFKEFNRRSYNLIDELESLGEDEFYNKYFNLSDYWIEDIIDLNDYTIEQQQEYCSAYYPKNEFNTLEPWIIAECIFEQTNGLY